MVVWWEIFKIGWPKEAGKTKVEMDPRVVNKDKFSNVRWKDNRHFRNEKKEYLKDKINQLEE
jgi:hypothetical protein